MAMKRKFDVDPEEVVPNHAKQLKLIPFPHVDSDDDAVMFDAETSSPQLHHTRFPSNVSSTSSNDSGSPVNGSPAYPTFDLYPLPFFTPEGLVDPNSHNYLRYSQAPTPPSVGLLQPSGSFVHHGSNCSQIPKLRVACAPGLNGQRTMWSFCEQCGAISMVEND